MTVEILYKRYGEKSFFVMNDDIFNDPYENINDIKIITPYKANLKFERK